MPDSCAIALSWRKSSVSASGDCVEVALASGSILVRDSKQRKPYVLEFTSTEWQAFLSGVRAGEFDLDNLEVPAT
jgi:predicted secreted Zn-dependent protease